MMTSDLFNKFNTKLQSENKIFKFYYHEQPEGARGLKMFLTIMAWG